MTKNTLMAPTIPDNIPNDAQWLSGEGSGSWFFIENYLKNYCITRFSPEGKIECKGIFRKISTASFSQNQYFEFTYLSHCSIINIFQNGIVHEFNLIEKCAY